MQKTFYLTLGLLTAGLSAQVPTGRGPTKVGTALNQTLLGPSSTSGSVFASVSPAIDEIKQFEFRVTTPGKFQTTMTVRRGGFAVDTITTGELDTTGNPWTFTEDLVSLSLLTTDGGFAGTMTPDLLVFAYDSGTGNAPQYSVRSATNVPFPVGKPIGTLNGFVDSKLYSRDGKDYFAFVSGQTVRAVEIDRTKFAAGTDPRVGAAFDILPFPGFTMHSQEVLMDNGGNARAFIHSTNNGPNGRARPWFNSIVQDGTAGNTELSRQFQVGPNDDTWLANPGALASTTIYAQAPPASAYGDPKQVELVCSSGGVIPATGGTFRLSAWLPYQKASNWAVTILIGVPSPDVTIPGFRGKLALQLGFFALTPKLWNANDLSQDWVLPAPAAAAGSPLWTQTLAFDPAGSVNGDIWYFGNTGPLTWQ